MPRELGDERTRYGRKSLRERAEDFLNWPGEHPILTGVILVFVVVGILLSVSRGLLVAPQDLAVGDCLFVRTGTAPDDARPIGDDRAATEAVLAGRMEQTSCSASHGHEVSALVDLTTLAYPTSESQVRCRDAFAGFVGRALEGSRYVTFAVNPAAGATGDGKDVGVCLVARADGQWMDHAARGSAE
jgi:hypothetical protein